MDVWFNTDGTFPGYLRAGAYDVLELSGSYYRRNLEFGDTHRNSYAVVSASEAGSVFWPCVYVDVITGQVVTAAATTPAISV
jgi:hypothetical protein